MTEKKEKLPTKAQIIIYRITTAITIIGMLAGGVAQLFRVEQQTNAFIQLGYPMYLMTIIGIWKILGAIVLSIPRFPPLLKTGAYVGLFFVTTSAVVSYVVHGDIGNAIAPFITAGIAVTSCLLNPNISFASSQNSKTEHQ